jgi:hypothetical protein
MYQYNFGKIFSMTTNIPYFEGLLHSFRSSGSAKENAAINFRFIVDNKLEIKTEGKPRINLMLYYDRDSNAVEFAYPWLRPIYARLVFGNDGKSYEFRFNKNYMRASNIAAEGWQIIDVFRSLLMISLMQSNTYMIHAGALKVGNEGILIPSFGNTGKTTTTWMLAKKGAEFLTDEFAILYPDGECLGFPCSSWLSPSLITEFGVKLSRREKLSLRLNEMRSKILTTRIAPGGIRLYPDKDFKLRDSIKINRIIFIQNGLDDARTVSEEEAVTMIKAIQSYELNWASNPFIIAESFFRPDLQIAKLSTKEDELIRDIMKSVKQNILVSSSSRQHFKKIETLLDRRVTGD